MVQPLDNPYELRAAPVARERWEGRVVRRALRFGTGLVLPLGVLVLWSIASTREWAPPQILPAPGLVRDTLIDELRSGDLASHVLISLERVLGGFFLGTLGGLLLGAAMGLSRRFEDHVYPLFNALAQVPVLAWVPLALLFLGVGESLKVVLIALATLLPVAVNTLRGFRGVPHAYLEVAETFRFTRPQLLRRVILPAAVPSIFVGLRQGLTQAWLSLVTVELLASSEGLGFLIVWARQLFQLDLVLVAIFAVGLVGLALDKGLAGIERRALRWRPVSEAGGR
jgi:sulfonate transport system permease protein